MKGFFVEGLFLIFCRFSFRKLMNTILTRLFFFSTALFLTPIPLRLQAKLLGNIAVFFYCFNSYYRRICRINISRCFPQKSEQEIERLCKKIFYSMGVGIAEALSTWQMSNERFNRIKVYPHGIENLELLQAKNKGVIIYTSHFSSIELIGRKMFGLCGAKVMYKKYSNSTFDQYVLRRRERYVDCIEKSNIKKTLSSLKKGATLAYLPDQNVPDRNRSSFIFESFFDIPCAISCGVKRLPEITGALPIFCYYYRDNLSLDYHIHFEKVNEPMTAGMYNKLLERAILKHPEQYFWLHRRFKTRPKGDDNNFYGLAAKTAPM
jgi:Kdo2-lipid IVA lauroyltransferase/acyltransferase